MNNQDLKTINDLTKQEYITYRKRVLKHYSKILEKHLSYSERNKLSFKSKFFLYSLFQENKFMREKGITTETDVKFSNNNLKIPIEFDVLMTAILSKNLRTVGIFRISANFAELNKIEKEFLVLIENNVIRNDLLNFLMQKDIITLCNLFTRTFNIFPTTLFPKALIDISLELFKIDTEEERTVIMRIIMLAFHFPNRQLFESIAKFSKKISEENCKGDVFLTKSMTLNAVCKVLAPKIFLCKNEIMNPLLLSQHVNLLEYFFENMEAIIRVETMFL
ncbi:hypothetical protein GVAV_000135 [Gurleya vavrai]